MADNTSTGVDMRRVLWVTQGELAIVRPGQYAEMTLASTSANPCVILAVHWATKAADFGGAALVHLDSQTDVAQTVALILKELAPPPDAFVTWTATSGDMKGDDWTRMLKPITDVVNANDLYTLDKPKEPSEHLAMDIRSGQVIYTFDQGVVDYGADLFTRLEKRKVLCQDAKPGTLPSTVTFHRP